MAKRMGRIEIQAARCKGCGLCVSACPTHALQLGEALNKLGYHPVEFIEEAGCTGCGVCFYACPEPAAIRVLLLKESAA